MTTLMRNGRDRRSENPRRAMRDKERVPYWLGPISGSHQGQRPKRLHRDGSNPPSENRPDTWLHPNASLKKSDSSCTAGAVHTWPFSEVRRCPVLRRDRGRTRGGWCAVRRKPATCNHAPCRLSENGVHHGSQPGGSTMITKRALVAGMAATGFSLATARSAS